MAVSAAFALRGVDENLFSIAAVASAVLIILFFFLLAIASLLGAKAPTGSSEKSSSMLWRRQIRVANDVAGFHPAVL